MNAAGQRRATPVLCALALVLGAVFVLLASGVGSTPHWDAPRAAAPLPPPARPAHLPRALPLQQFALVWQKPLFSPDRRPLAHAADGGSSLGDLTLTGVILTPTLHMALLHDRNGDRQVRLRVGERLPSGDLTLVEVRARSALFDTPSGRTELKLPAGAPIDTARDKPPAAAPPVDASTRGDVRAEGIEPESAFAPQAADTSAPQAPAPTPARTQRAPAEATPSAAVRRLRETIQKRRAAQAAAAQQGVR
jgi:general secretion pathway protein N